MPKAKKQQYSFTKFTSFEQWNDKHGGEYYETEIDGHLVGILLDPYNSKKMVGIWYNGVRHGTIIQPSFPLNSVYSEVDYTELDPHYPESWDV